VPSVLLDAQAAKTLIKNHGVTEKKWQESKKRIEKMLTNPSTSDPVYQHLMRIFDYDGDLNLKRTKKLRFTIRNLARKRFALGYPPRKHNATSLGDSINWEWIIHCAINSKDYHNVLIVSRDSDQTEQGASARDIERPMSHVPVHNGKPHVDWAFPNDGRDIRPGHEGKSATIGAADELAGRLPW
jgi:hypothetical protein